MPFQSLPTVNPGESILSSWGNLIDSNFDDHEARVVALNALITRLTADSGNLSAPAQGSYTGNVQYRRVGAWVWVQSNISYGASWGPNDLVWATVLPAGYRPTQTVYGQYQVYANNWTSKLEILATGGMTWRNVQLGASGGTLTGSVVYPIALP